MKLDRLQRLAVAMSPGRGGSGSQPWSNATIDFNGLNYVDAQARISAAEIGASAMAASHPPRSTPRSAAC